MNLHQKALIAELAYEPDRKIITNALADMFPDCSIDIRFIYVEATDTEGFMVRREDEIILSFAGTESWKDLLLDLWFTPGHYELGDEKVVLHSGFAKIINQVFEPTVTAFLELIDWYLPTWKITGIGHSLGASIVMGVLDKIGYFFPGELDKMAVTTFGCPACWSRESVNNYNQRIPVINYINRFDYVTWLFGLTTCRPGEDVKLPGQFGHLMRKYVYNSSGFITAL